MKKQNLSLSLLIGAALTIPSLAMAAPTQADMQVAAADNAMQTEATSATSDMGSDQSSPFAINETQTISRASMNSVNNNANPQAMPTEQQPQGNMPLQTQQQNMQNPEEAMMQEQNAQQDMMQEEGAQQDMMQEEGAQQDMMQEEDAQQDMMQDDMAN